MEKIVEEENGEQTRSKDHSPAEDPTPKASSPSAKPKLPVHFQFLLNDEPGNVDIDDEKEILQPDVELTVTGKVFKGKKHYERSHHSISGPTAKTYGTVPKTPPPFATTPTESEIKITHPKGTYFRDQKRRIDYVLVYEQHSRYKSVAHTIHNLRKLVRESSFSKASTNDDNETPEAGADTEIDQRREFFLSQLMKCGLELELHEYCETDKKQVFVKVHAPFSVLTREAERLRMKLPLLIRDESVIDNTGSTFWSKLFKKPQNEVQTGLDDPPSIFGDHIMWTFSNDQSHRFYLPDKPESIFSPCQRSEIVWEVMQLARNDPAREKRRGIESLVEHHIIDAAFPLHDGDYEIQPGTEESELTSRQRLHLQWATVRRLFRFQPLTRIRNYFGEKVAFYFAFMDFYTKMLIVPSIVGMIIFAYGIVSSYTANYYDLAEICDKERAPGNYVMCPICQPPACEPYIMGDEGCQKSYWQYRLDNVMTIVSATFGVLWCAIFAKFWRRREARHAAEWGTYDVEESTRTIRPQYEKKSTTLKPNPVTGELEPHIPMRIRMIRKTASVFVTLAFLCLAVLCLALLIVYRIYMYGFLKQLGGIFHKYNIDIARWLQHGLIFVMVTIFELVYHHVAVHLTKLECPKTSAGFAFGFLWKVFIFVEIVDFLPIAYAAWFKGRGTTPNQLSPINELCEAGGCMSEVVEIVATLLLLRLFFQNIAEVGIPALKAAFKRSSTQKRGVKRDRFSSMAHMTRWSQYLKDYQLGEMNIASDYMEMMIQFSFVAFYVPALPLVPLICLINNIFEIRIDAVNCLATHRRSCPNRVPGIEIWNQFIDIMVKASVLVNAALLAFTSEIVPHLFHNFEFSSNTFVSYVVSSMSWQPIAEWPRMKNYINERLRDMSEEEIGEYGFLKNLTQCAYFGYRNPRIPHEATIMFFRILSARAFAFIAFVVFFCCLIYLIDSCIDDVPRNVKNRIKRQQYVVMKALEHDAYRRRMSQYQVESE